MSEHFDPDEMLVTECDGCGATGGGWDEVHNKGWMMVDPWLDNAGNTRIDRGGVFCPDCRRQGRHEWDALPGA
jgi:hypothetical protein